MSVKFGLTVINEERVPAYRRRGFGDSIPDITFASEEQTEKIRDWRVTEEYTGSDHQYVYFNVTYGRQRMKQIRICQRKRWNIHCIDTQFFEKALDMMPAPAENISNSPMDGNRAVLITRKTTKLLIQLCDLVKKRLKRVTERFTGGRRVLQTCACNTSNLSATPTTKQSDGNPALIHGA